MLRYSLLSSQMRQSARVHWILTSQSSFIMIWCVRILVILKHWIEYTKYSDRKYQLIRWFGGPAPWPDATTKSHWVMQAPWRIAMDIPNRVLPDKKWLGLSQLPRKVQQWSEILDLFASQHPVNYQWPGENPKSSCWYSLACALPPECPVFGSWNPG